MADASAVAPTGQIAYTHRLRNTGRPLNVEGFRYKWGRLEVLVHFDSGLRTWYDLCQIVCVHYNKGDGMMRLPVAGPQTA